MADQCDSAPSILTSENSGEILESASNLSNRVNTAFVYREEKPCVNSGFVYREEQPYENLNSRCETFKDWPLHHFIKPFHLAKAGFYYTGLSNTVQCYECKIRLKSFELDDIPMLEHCRWSPKCAVVRKFFKFHKSS